MPTYSTLFRSYYQNHNYKLSFAVIYLFDYSQSKIFMPGRVVDRNIGILHLNDFLKVALGMRVSNTSTTPPPPRPLLLKMPLPIFN